MDRKMTINIAVTQVNAAGTVAASFVEASIPAATKAQLNLKPTLVVINAEAQGLRWRDDGVAPTSSVGMLIPSGATFEYTGNISNLRIINAAAGAIANLAFYG